MLLWLKRDPWGGASFVIYAPLTVVGEADFKAAHQGEGREVGQAAQTKQYSTHGVELTGEFSKEPPAHGDEDKKRNATGA